MTLHLVEKSGTEILHTADSSDRIEKAGVKAVLNLFKKWELSDTDACILLGGISSATYSRWKRGDIGKVKVDLRSRLSALLGIHKALSIIFTDSERCYKWIKKANETYGGSSALDIMKQGTLTDLLRVRQYLDFVRGR